MRSLAKYQSSPMSAIPVIWISSSITVRLERLPKVPLSAENTECKLPSMSSCWPQLTYIALRTNLGHKYTYKSAYPWCLCRSHLLFHNVYDISAPSCSILSNRPIAFHSIAIGDHPCRTYLFRNGYIGHNCLHRKIA